MDRVAALQHDPLPHAPARVMYKTRKDALLALEESALRGSGKQHRQDPNRKNKHRITCVCATAMEGGHWLPMKSDMLICMRRSDEGQQQFRRRKVAEATTLWKEQGKCPFQAVLRHSSSTGMWTWQEYSVDGNMCTFIPHARSCAAPLLKASGAFMEKMMGSIVRADPLLSGNAIQALMTSSGSSLNSANLSSKSVLYKAKKQVADEELRQYDYRMSALEPYLREFKSKNPDSHVVLEKTSDNSFKRCVCFMLVHWLTTKYSRAPTRSFFPSFLLQVLPFVWKERGHRDTLRHPTGCSRWVPLHAQGLLRRGRASKPDTPFSRGSHWRKSQPSTCDGAHCRWRDGGIV